MYKFLVVFLLLSSTAQSQMLSGTLVEEGRKMLTETDFTFKSLSTGYANYELAVDREGNVTGVRLVETNIKSTPTTYELRNHVKNLKFQKGTYYPKFHHVIVKFTTVL